MAFYSEKPEEEEEGTGQTVGPESGTIGSNAAAPGSASGTSDAPKAEPFVGISQYINANKPQSEKLAGQVVSKIDEKANAADSALNSAQNSFNQSADAQKVADDADLLNQVKTNATSVTGDQNKVNSFTKLRDASYTGPQKLEDLDQGQTWAGIQSTLNKAKQAKSALGTEEGRMGLIKEISNNPRQSQGGLVFDNLLLQSNPNSAQKLQNAGSSINTFNERLSAADQAASAKANEIKSANEGIAQKARGALTAGYTGLQNDLASREATADAEQLGQVNALKNAIQTGQLTPEQLAQIKMQLSDKTYGTDLSQFINYQDGVDKYSVASQDDIARQNALKSLAGDYSLGDDILSSSSPLGQKGTGFTTDLSGFQSAKDATVQAYNQKLNSKDLWQSLPQPDGQGGYTVKDPKYAGDTTLPEQIQKLEQSLPELKSSDYHNYTRVKNYLQDILYPARDKVMAEFNYNQTLGQGVPGTTRTGGV